MKSITMIRSLVLLAVLAAGAVSCQKEEHPATGGDAPQGTPLTIHVVDGGYMASDKSSVAQTRATENGYTTQFTAGDKIGLYVVVDGTIVSSNIPLTHNGTGWTGDAYYEGTAAKYFAYYPYQSSLTGTPDPLAIDAAGFFADVVSQWNPATDQSTSANYTDQDLMVGSGTVSKQADAYTLAFTMTHAMALVVIETPITKYTLTDKNSNSLPDYYIPAPNTKFYGFTPCFIDGKYRLLVKPGQNGANDLVGSYTAASGNTKEYSVSQNSIATANYKHYRVDNATVITKTHTLQAGDFYLKDGSLLGKDATPTAEQKTACLGIVYWVGDPTNATDGDPLLARDKSSCRHGLVVALHEAAAKMKWSNSYEQVNNWTNHTDRGGNKVNITEENRYQGYANTVALKAYNAQQSNADLKVLPIAAVEQYQIDYSTPSNSSGWYVPSFMELKYICWGQGNDQGIIGLDLLNGQFAKVGGTNFSGSLSDYWSSSENAYSGVRGVYFFDGEEYTYDKNFNGKVRAVSAF